MKQFLLMRHAKSSWSNSSLADKQRPLNSRGKRDAPRMAEFLVGRSLVPDLILCSTSERTRQTAAGMLSVSGFSSTVEYHDNIYHADYQTYLELLANLAEDVERPMILGHNPEMDYFLEMMCGEDEHMTTANVAHIQLQVETWAQLNDEVEANLLALWRPREIENER